MSKANKLLIILTSVLLALPKIALSQHANDEDALRSSVIVAVAKSLGSDPSNLPNYQADLQAARKIADTTSLCAKNAEFKFLTPDVAKMVVQRAVDLLKQKNPSLWERPRYVRDLITVSAISFEAGRFVGTSKEYREELAANAPAQSRC